MIHLSKPLSFTVSAREGRRLNIAASSLLLCGLALALLALAGRNGIVSPSVVGWTFAAARWVCLAAMVSTTVYVFRSGFAERMLTVRYACVALVLSAVFGVAWLTMLRAAGVQFGGMHATNFDAVLWPVLLPTLVAVSAPWSLNRVRHMCRKFRCSREARACGMRSSLHC